MIATEGLPRVSVIVTSFNYANYLRAALDSVLDQTRPAHELIVVDDGSTDGSRDVLETYGNRIKTILGPNRGQAASFETGFRASSGDIIIFLDADDALKPEAIETLRTAWHPTYAAICYGMELVDRAGQPCGLYPERVDDFDRRALLVDSGSFPFMPTSGNAFARRTVERACPFPAERWRLGADAYIVRVAAIEGRIFPLKQVLACYRIHPGNNYFRVGASQIWLDRRGNIDIADLAAYFAEWPALGGDPSQQPAERIRLANAAVRTQLTLDADRRRPGPALRHLARRLAMTHEAPLVPRLTAAAVAAALGLGLWRFTDAEDWLRFPHHRPAWLRRLLEGLGQRRLRHYLAIAKEPRWRGPTPPGQFLDPARNTDAMQCLGVGWTTPRLSGRAICSGRHASLSFNVAPTPAAITIDLEIACGRPEEKLHADVEVSYCGFVLSRLHVQSAATITMLLPAGTAKNGGEIVLDLRFGAANRLQRGLRLGPVRGLAPPMELRAFRVSLESAMDPGGLIEGRAQRFDRFLRPGTAEWTASPDGSAVLVAASGAVSLVTVTAARAMLELRLPSGQPRGWMRISLASSELFAGRWGEVGDRLWCSLPRAASDDPRGTHVVHHLTFAFAPEDSLETERPSIAAIVFHPEREASLLHRDPHPEAPLINPGQLLTFAATDQGRLALGESWLTGDETPALSRGDGTLRLFAPPGFRDLEIHLAIEPAFATATNRAHLVTVLRNDEVLARVNLHGEAVIVVPVGDVQGEFVLRILSLSIATDAFGTTVDEEAPLEPAPLRLRSLAIEGSWDTRGEPLRAVRFPGHVETLIERGEGGSALAAGLVKADERALISTVASARSVDALADLGRQGMGTAAVDRPVERIGRIRAIIAAIAQGPAYAQPWVADLAGLPEPLLWFPDSLASWLAADPPILAVEDARRYEAYLLALLKSAGDLIASEPPGSARRTLAIAVFGMLRPQQLLFRAGTLRAYMGALAGVGERLFTLDGFQLPCRFPQRTVDRLRVGIIVRNWDNNPERRIAEATIQGLDPERFEPLAILLSELTGDEAAGTVSIAGLPVTQAVDYIRSLGLEVLVLGSFFLRFDTLAAVVAHKLAPLQIATAAVSPVTTGLSSFDALVSSDLIEPPDAADHYSEPVVSVPGPIQAFAPSSPGPSIPAESRDETRTRLGLPMADVLLVSGAMMQKIGSDLLDAWASVLAATEGTRLVLYPFALNWSVDFAEEAFRKAALAALSTKDVAADRLIILGPLEPADVRHLLRAADVYLDAFPYAGAATVTEALEEGLPIVSLLGDNQRGRQGAGWLRAFGLDDDIAVTVDAYIARATALAADAGLREHRRALVAARHGAGSPHLDSRGTAARFGAAVLDLADRKGIRVRPTG